MSRVSDSVCFVHVKVCMAVGCEEQCIPSVRTDQIWNQNCSTKILNCPDIVCEIRNKYVEVEKEGFLLFVFQFPENFLPLFGAEKISEV